VFILTFCTLSYHSRSDVHNRFKSSVYWRITTVDRLPTTTWHSMLRKLPCNVLPSLEILEEIQSIAVCDRHLYLFYQIHLDFNPIGKELMLHDSMIYVRASFYVAQSRLTPIGQREASNRELYSKRKKIRSPGESNSQPYSEHLQIRIITV
jgi:hypothetical protein